MGKLNTLRVKLVPHYYARSAGWVVLTTTGRRTGLPRQTLLPCSRRGGEVVVVSTYGWRSDWIRNLRKDPAVKVTRYGATVDGVAEVVEDVKQLSAAEKEELHGLLKKYLIEERRREILENAKTGMEEMRRGELKSFSNVDELMDSLSHD